MTTVLIDTTRLVGEEAWIAYQSGVQAFLRRRNAPPMRSNETVAMALGRATRHFVRCTPIGIEFDDSGSAEQFLDCVKRALTAHSPSLGAAVQLGA